MNQQAYLEGEVSSKGSVEPSAEGKQTISPDYPAWRELTEVSKDTVGRFLDFLAPRSIADISIIIAPLCLLLLARDMIATGGGMSSSQRFICVIILAMMIWTPALYLLYSRRGNKFHAENLQGAKDPPEPRDE